MDHTADMECVSLLTGCRIEALAAEMSRVQAEHADRTAATQQACEVRCPRLLNRCHTLPWQGSDMLPALHLLPAEAAGRGGGGLSAAAAGGGGALRRPGGRAGRPGRALAGPGGGAGGAARTGGGGGGGLDGGGAGGGARRGGAAAAGGHAGSGRLSSAAHGIYTGMWSGAGFEQL